MFQKNSEHDLFLTPIFFFFLHRTPDHGHSAWYFEVLKNFFWNAGIRPFDHTQPGWF